MAKEIELKLRLSRAQSRRLIAHRLLAGVAPQKYPLFNTYYDTPDFALRRRGIALRLRRKGWALWLMTVKTGDSGVGGLAQRSEWEAQTQPGVFDFAIVTDPDLREFLQARQSELQAVFTTDFTRCAWTLNYAGARIELALDRGTISATPADLPARCEALCEVELELLEGPSSDPLFALAIALAADLQLHPEIASKAERGYALAAGVAPTPVRAQPSPLTAELSPVEAFRAIALSCLAQLQGNEAGAVAGGNPEYVHQARVAIRRLRSAFNLFAPVLNPAFVAVYSPRWRKLAAGLGSARDWDVFLTETLSPLEEAFPGDDDLALLRERGEATKARAQALAAEALQQKAYSQLLLAFSAALFRVEPPTVAADGKSSEVSLAKFARRRLRKRARMVEVLAGEHGKMNAERRHELRIAFKKLRYALEFFSPLLPGKRLAVYQASLATIQERLGTLNDQVTASRLIKEMHPKGDPAPLTRGWIAGRTQLLTSALSDELRGLLVSKPPWR